MAENDGRDLRIAAVHPELVHFETVSPRARGDENTCSKQYQGRNRARMPHAGILRAASPNWQYRGKGNMKNQGWIIAGAAVFFWLTGGWVFSAGVPNGVQIAFGLLFILVVAGLVAFLISRASAWHALAQKHPARSAYRGEWKASGYFLMAPVSYEDPDFMRKKHRLAGIVRIGATTDALFLRCVKPFHFLLPPLQIPLRETTSRTVEVSRLMGMQGQAGPIIQANFEIGPGGEFIEIHLQDPPVYILFESHLLVAA
jgi:hypothetical protein